ncbi:hypothetical protein [Hymenobacter sp. YC55]|uniref:hypothetical protein n=1 Tax=Hymenobacter sp. YC55 TaxID=3034019 RepID=UPI0023F9B87A|nr:hypothetical protein [Hymenobacter sp. YC55]MDF7813866.1 hypothetical protein [Hymenobacter sp. YC55]
METALLVLLVLLLGLATFVGFSIRRHAHEVARNLRAHQAYQVQQATEQVKEKEPA